jgi:hypothetical protein
LTRRQLELRWPVDENEVPVASRLHSLIEQFERDVGSEWRRRYKCVIANQEAFFTGGMQFVVRNLGSDQFEVRYEHAPHEVTTEVGDADRLVRVLGKLVNRRHLEKIEV